MTKTVQKRVGLSDLAMQSNPTGADQWFPDDGRRTGHGKLYGRITKRGERSFVLRYTGPDGRYVNWLIGRYEPKASGQTGTSEAWVLAQAVLSLGLARRKAALRAAEKLQAAADAVAEFSMACLECNDGSVRGSDDSRVILSTSMREYAGWLESVFGK